MDAAPRTSAELGSYVMQTAAHELTHFLREKDPSRYVELKDFVVQKLIEAGKVENGKTLRQLIQDKRALYEQHGQTKAMQKYLGEMSKIWSKGVFGEGEIQTSETAAPESGVKYSIKNTKEESLQQQFRDFYSGNMESSDSFYFGGSTPAMETVGVYGPIEMNQSDFKKSSKEKHNTPRRVFNHLLDNLRSPIFSFYNGNTAVFLIDDIDADGKPVIVAFDKNGIMDRQHVSEIKSVYGLDNSAAWIKNQYEKEGKIFKVFDKEKAASFLQTYGYKASVGDQGDYLSKTIAQEKKESNPQKTFSLQEQDAVSDRELLANTPLDAAKDDGELRRLGDYKKQLDVFFTAQDALNIDLKSFDAAVYRKTLGGDLETVKRFIEMACAACHVELTTLIVPGLNDSEAEMRALSGWIASLPNGEEIPLHITRFFPRYRMRDRAATERRSVLRLAEIAKEALKFVYTGNMQYLA